jgi:hypothetical protein
MSTQPTRLPPEDLLALSAYLDDELAPSEREVLEQRLATDSHLRAELDSLRHTVELLRALPRLRAPHDFTLNPAVYGKQARLKVIPLHKLLWRAGGLAAVAASLVLVFGVLLLGGSADKANESLSNRQSAQQFYPTDNTVTAAFARTEIAAQQEMDTEEAGTAVAFAPNITSEVADGVSQMSATALIATQAAGLGEMPSETTGFDTASGIAGMATASPMYHLSPTFTPFPLNAAAEALPAPAIASDTAQAANRDNRERDLSPSPTMTPPPSSETPDTLAFGPPAVSVDTNATAAATGQAAQVATSLSAAGVSTFPTPPPTLAVVATALFTATVPGNMRTLQGTPTPLEAAIMSTDEGSEQAHDINEAVPAAPPAATSTSGAEDQGFKVTTWLVAGVVSLIISVALLIHVLWER